jgi:hypothetical protein
LVDCRRSFDAVLSGICRHQLLDIKIAMCNKLAMRNRRAQ